MGKIFGTDGVRGIANTELTPELAYKVGRCGAYVLTKEFRHKPKVIIGKDTRISGDMLEASLVAGMCSVGATVYVAKVVPTPAIPFLIKKYNLDAGVMISASHNHVRDNGIKFFNKNGFKLSDSIEEEIESLILNDVDNLPRPIVEEVGHKEYIKTSCDEFIDFLKSTVNGVTLDGLKIVLDCANGATYEVGPRTFTELGANVVSISNEPNGININDNCGSTHLQNLQKKVVEEKANIGFAFDGDGDRCLIVDEKGNTVEGDEILSILAMEMKKNHKLNKNTIVATIMSNLGLSIMGEKENIKIEQTSVGDRYILEKMLQDGYNLGGEQSGHIIMTDYNTTGDGVLAALQIAVILKNSKKSFSELNTIMYMLPQSLCNAKVDNSKKYEYEKNEEIQNAIKKIEEKYSSEGRVLIRPSGTEPLVRVMIEGKDKAELDKDAKSLADLIESKLGV